MQTRCPHCHTLFGVSTDQLKAHGGKVRCGNCRQVFNAFDSLQGFVPPRRAQPAPLRRAAPSLKDINPRLEIQFDSEKDEAAGDGIRLKIDDYDLAALEQPILKTPQPAPTAQAISQAPQFVAPTPSQQTIPQQPQFAPVTQNQQPIQAPPQPAPTAQPIQVPPQQFVTPAEPIQFQQAVPQAPIQSSPVQAPIPQPAPATESIQFQTAIPTEVAQEPLPALDIETFLAPSVELPAAQIFQEPEKPADAPQDNLQLQIELAPSIAPDTIVMEDIPPATVAPNTEPLFSELPNVEPVSTAPEVFSGISLTPDSIAPEFVEDLEAPEVNETTESEHATESLFDKITALESEFEEEEKEWLKKLRSLRKKKKNAPETKPTATFEKTSLTLPPAEQATFSVANTFVSKEDLFSSEPNEPSFKTPETPPQLEKIETDIGATSIVSMASIVPLNEVEETTEPSGSGESAQTSTDIAWYAAPAFLEQQSAPQYEVPAKTSSWGDLSALDAPKAPRCRVNKAAIAACFLILLLAAQVFFLFRADIVERAPALRPIYATLGIALPLQTDLSLLTIESSDLNIDNVNGIFKLQATLGNHARFNQAWPNLELVLTDSLDQAIAHRVLKPAEYLKDPSQPAFKAQSEDHIQLWLEAQNLEAVGYRLSIFYPKKERS